ncbi:MAG: hypothetical protein GTN81_07180 [Proteobacteria bacterium]|nr:hypothetical protein [Pseudomonadota bacterium]
MYHYTGGVWVRETTNRTLDTENNTISTEVTSLSPFIAGEDPQGSTSVGGGGGAAAALSQLPYSLQTARYRQDLKRNRNA